MNKKVNREYRNNKPLLIIFLILEVVIYLSFLYLDMIGSTKYDLNNYLKYTSILLCVLFQVLYYHRLGLVTLFLKLAIITTAVADYFLLIKGNNELGVSVFIYVHLFYMIKLHIEDIRKNGIKQSKRQNKKISFIGIIALRYIVIIFNTFIVSLIFSYFGVEIDGLFIVTSIYFQSLIYNTFVAVKSVIGQKDKMGNYIFAAGMLLFLLCDINVGLYNLTYYLDVSEELYSLIYAVSSISMWFFYLPSQILISISEVKRK